MKRSGVKAALLAATMLAASGGAIHAAEAAPPPVEIAAPADHAADESKAPTAIVKKVSLAAAITGALAALFHGLGARRLSSWIRAARPLAARTARIVVETPIAAAKAAGRAAASPLRFALAMAGLGVFALTGLSLFDLEWAGGLLAGAGMVALAWAATGRARRVFARAGRPHVTTRIGPGKADAGAARNPVHH